jgi:hypothetical protein
MCITKSNIMKTLKGHTLKELLNKILISCKRFPITIGAIIVLNIIFLIFNHKRDIIISDQFSFFCFFYFVPVVFLSTTLHLWAEEIQNRKKSLMIQIIVHVLWLICAIYLSYQVDLQAEPIMMAFLAPIVMFIISTVMISFYKEKNDIQLWNFSMRIILMSIVSILIGLVFMVGISLLLLFFGKLSGVDISDKTYIDFAICSFLLLVPIVFLALIPEKEKKHNSNSVQWTKFGHGVMCFILSLLGLYVAVLYVYALKIIFTWSLPCGKISWLVAILIFGMVTVIFFLYPKQFGNITRYTKSIIHYLPLIVLPLLLLMTIGIIRRFSDYGITISRIYLLVFNIWCYTICIGLFLNHQRRIGWIPASFGIVFFLLSVGPQNVSNLTRHILLNEVSKEMNNSGIKHRPMSAEEYQACIERLDSLSAYRIDDKISYLRSSVSCNSTNLLLDKYVMTGSVQLLKYGYILSFEDQGNLFNEPTDIPRGYAKMFYIDEQYSTSKEEIKNGIIPLTITYKDKRKEGKEVFLLSIEKMKGLNAENRNQMWTLQSTNAILYVKYFNFYTFYENNGGSIRGILLLKK